MNDTYRTNIVKGILDLAYIVYIMIPMMALIFVWPFFLCISLLQGIINLIIRLCMNQHCGEEAILGNKRERLFFPIFPYYSPMPGINFWRFLFRLVWVEEEFKKVRINTEYGSYWDNLWEAQMVIR